MSHENNFASYVETLIPDDLRDNNLLTDLPQKSRRYDVANSRYHCSKFIYAVEALTQADDFTYTDDCEPTDQEPERALVYIAFMYMAEGGREGGSESGLRFQTAITRKRYTINMVLFSGRREQENLMEQTPGTYDGV